MMQQLVLTAVGPDRPGLVAKLSGRLLDSGANVADSRMVNLRGQFALLLLLAVPQGKSEVLGKILVTVGQELGLLIQVSPRPAGEMSQHQGVPYRLRTYAMDQSGIVHRISHVLHEHDVNIEELKTCLEAGAYSAAPLFTMEMSISVPPSVQVKKLRRELETLCDSLNCDVDLEPG